MSGIARRVRKGEVQAAARLMRDLDDGVPGSAAALRELYRSAGRAHVVGLTGPAGCGKSSLVDRLVEAARREGLSVGVVAVDPTSHISGGAVLGDRVRMQRHARDPKVFIRSLASRGSLGGLSRSVFDTVTVLDAMGKDLVLLETAGTGQDGVKVSAAAHTVVVVLAPGMGDEIQAIKAGVLEIGDVYAVNKCDRPGCEPLLRGLRWALEGKACAVVKTSAASGAGVGELFRLVREHRGALERAGEWELRCRGMARAAFLERLETGCKELFAGRLESDPALRRLQGELARRRTDPSSAARRALALLVKGGEAA